MPDLQPPLPPKKTTRGTLWLVAAIGACVLISALVGWRFAQEDAANLPRTGTPNAGQSGSAATDRDARGSDDDTKTREADAAITAVDPAARWATEHTLWVAASREGRLGDAAAVMRAAVAQRDAQHGWPLARLIETLDELGDGRIASQLAAEFLAAKNKEVWAAKRSGVRHTAPTLAAAHADPVPTMLRVLAANRQLDSVRWQTAIVRWSNELDGASADVDSAVWALGYARAVASPAEATLAVAELDPAQPLPHYNRTPDGPLKVRLFGLAAEIGSAMAMGGRGGRAVDWLELATSDKAFEERPIATQRARLVLAELLAATPPPSGTNPAADTPEQLRARTCAVYLSIVRDWPHPRPRSVTVDKARTAVQALRCEPPTKRNATHD